MYAKDTTVAPIKSRHEIEELLGKHKAQHYIVAVDHEHNSARVQFKLKDRVVRFTVELPTVDRFPVGTQKRRQAEQLERQRWRALLLVIKAKLESHESGIETFEEAFMPQIVMPNDHTVGEMLTPSIVDAYRTGLMPKRPLGLPAPADTDQEDVTDGRR